MTMNDRAKRIGRFRRQPRADLLHTLGHKRSIGLLGLVLFVAIAGVIYVGSSRAANSSVTVEAESGTLSTATAVDSPGASGGKMVSFAASGGSGGGGKTGNCIAPAGLKITDTNAGDGQLPPWRHTLGDAAVIYYAIAGLAEEYAEYTRQGAALWNVSPCLDLKVVETCPASTNCVTVKTSTEQDGSTDGYFESYYNGSKTYMTRGEIVMLTTALQDRSAAYKRMVMAHEMGHSVSLEHRLTRNDLMYATSGESVELKADQTNLNNILALYGVESEAVSTPLSKQATPEDTVVRRDWLEPRPR